MYQAIGQINIEIGKIYKQPDSNPTAFGKVIKVTEEQFWDEDEEDDALSILVWGDWYQWIDGKVYCIHNAGFEADHLVKATGEEVAVYAKKVDEYKVQEEE